MPDLELATVDEIVEELAKRHIAVVVAAVRGDKTRNGKEVFSAYYRGGFTTCCGLSGRLDSHMLRVADSTVEAQDGDDEGEKT